MILGTVWPYWGTDCCSFYRIFSLVGSGCHAWFDKRDCLWRTVHTVWENQLSSIQCVMIMVAELLVRVLCLIFSESTFCIQLHNFSSRPSSTVYSVRLCTVHIGPSRPCQTQTKETAVHYLKHTQEATSAFSNCQHKYLNVYIFQCCAYSNYLPVAQEF